MQKIENAKNPMLTEPQMIYSQLLNNEVESGFWLFPNIVGTKLPKFDLFYIQRANGIEGVRERVPKV